VCGVAGVFAYAQGAPPVDAAALLRMREAMQVRGPDGAGLWTSADGRVGLAHRRLAIIDLSTDGAQPMTSTDGRYRIVFNGEIYNYRELRLELLTGGIQFRTASDTEVLLQLYAMHGASMCKKLRGMYAFAIWDELEQSLLLARDPFGIKPVYVHNDGRVLRFASQVKALMASGSIPPEIDVEADAGFWLWGYVPEPRTLYRDVVALTPGSWLKLDRDGRSTSGVFESVENLLAGDEDAMPAAAEPAQTLRDAVVDSMRHHLISDVPVGLFLSAGIDSATLAALAVQCGASLQTVTLGFLEYKGTEADETVLAEEIARRYGTRHRTVWISRADFEESFEAFVHTMDQPSIDGLNTWLVAQAAASVGLKVALSGLGGDEFFGGYPSFRQLPRIVQLARPFSSVPQVGRTLRRMSAPLLRRFTSEKLAGLVEYGGTWEGAYMLRRAVRMPWELEAGKATQDIARRRAGDGRPDVDWRPRLRDDPHAVVSALEATCYMRNQLLRDSDWAAMAHSIELRVPLVDVNLTRFIARQRRIGRRYSKLDLASCADPALPESVTRRPKTGFTVPVRDWLLEAAGAGPSVAKKRGLRSWQEAIRVSFAGNTHPEVTGNAARPFAL
jgi:asparagine synthase (glutamine-hydrolysing)